MPPFSQANPTLHQIFLWSGPPGEQRGNRTHYEQFTLNNQMYKLGDCVYLYPEDEALPHYIGKIKSAFVDSNNASQDPHCIEVLWFERRVNLETSTRGLEESEREVFELGDTDVNPIGCISGKCSIIKARTYEEAVTVALMHARQEEWYFCRGYFLQQQNTFQPYSTVELVNPDAHAVQPVLGSRVSSHLMHQNNKEPIPNMASISEEGDPDFSLTGHPGGRLNGSAFVATHLLPHQSERANSQDGEGGGGDGKAALAAAARKKVTGRVCAECSATTTPQWREGPAGPKTLCNACGVRYVRSQQRLGKKPGGGPISKRDAVTLNSDRAGAKGGPKTSPPNKADDGYPGYGSAMSKGQQQDLNNGGSSRPVRQVGNRYNNRAAKVSANRTAAFARTGDYSSEDEEELDEDGYAAAATNRRKRSTGNIPAVPQQQRAGGPGIRPATLGEENPLPSHHVSDSAVQQHLPISALSLPVSNLFSTSLPRQSPPPLSALPASLDQHEFGYGHSIPPNLGSRQQPQPAYPHTSYPNIVPIPDYLMAFTTQALPLSDDPYALLPAQQNHLKQEEPIHNNSAFSNPSITHNNSHILNNIKIEQQQQEQPHLTQYGDTGQPVLASSMLQQQQQQAFGLSHLQPYPIPYPHLARGMDAFSTAQPLQLSTFGVGPEMDPLSFLFQPMYPSTSSASASASYPAAAMPSFPMMAPPAFSSGTQGQQSQHFPNTSQATSQQLHPTSQPALDSHLFTQQPPLLAHQQDKLLFMSSIQSTPAHANAPADSTPQPSVPGDSYPYSSFDTSTAFARKHSQEVPHTGNNSNNHTGTGNGIGSNTISALVPNDGLVPCAPAVPASADLGQA